MTPPQLCSICTQTQSNHSNRRQLQHSTALHSKALHSKALHSQAQETPVVTMTGNWSVQHNLKMGTATCLHSRQWHRRQPQADLEAQQKHHSSLPFLMRRGCPAHYNIGIAGIMCVHTPSLPGTLVCSSVWAECKHITDVEVM